MDLSISSDVRDEVTLVHVGGEIDVYTAPVLRDHLDEHISQGRHCLVVDLGGVTFMDSTGLRLVIRWDTAAKADGFEFAIVPGVEVVQRVFRLTGMDEHLQVAEPPPE